MLASKRDRSTFGGVSDQEDRQRAPKHTMLEDSHLSPSLKGIQEQLNDRFKEIEQIKQAIWVTRDRAASEVLLDQRDAVSASMKPLFEDYLQQKCQEIADALCSKYDYPPLATTVLVLDNQ